MIELYLFIFSLIASFAILLHRAFVIKKENKKAFKEIVSAKVEENRKNQKKEGEKRFKETHLKNQDAKKHDVGKFKDEMRRADMALSKKNFAEAKRYLIQAMSLTDDHTPVSLKLASVYLESQDYKKAESLYRKLLEENTENAAVYENFGKIMLKKKDYKEAIKAYVRAVELDGKDDQKFIALGKLYHLMMRYGVAAECFKRAAELKPRDVDYLFLLAESCSADDDLENALFTYERILTIEPYNEKAKSSTQDVRLKIKEQEALFKS